MLKLRVNANKDINEKCLSKINKNNDSVCYMNCAGDKSTKCGASYKNSVYEIVYQTTTQRPSTTVITSLSSNINLIKTNNINSL
jgi:hypothetical protein